MDTLATSDRKEISQRVTNIIFSPGVENERADAGQDGRTCLAGTTR